jgi:hypothetical protein
VLKFKRKFRRQRVNKSKTSNSECSAWVSIRRLTRLRYAVRRHTFKLHILQTLHSISPGHWRAASSSVHNDGFGPLHRHTKKKKAGHPCYRATNVFITAYADIEKMDMPTPKESGTCNYVISSPCIWSVTFQLTHTRSRPTPAYCSTRPSNPVPVYHSLISMYLFTL